MRSIKQWFFARLGAERFSRLMQRGYFVLYGLGVLRLFSVYDLHYYVRRLIHKGDTVVDIGANLGYYSILFARWVGRQGRVEAVEPIALYNKIYTEKARRYPQIRLHSCALGTEDGRVWMVNTQSAHTGLPHVYDPQQDGPLERIDFKYEAPMRRPSELFAHLDRIDYLKCDIEGYEAVVLDEMKGLIAKHRPIVQVEVWGANEGDIRRMFEAMGYVACKLVKGKLVAQGMPAAASGDYLFIAK